MVPASHRSRLVHREGDHAAEHRVEDRLQDQRDDYDFAGLVPLTECRSAEVVLERDDGQRPPLIDVDADCREEVSHPARVRR